jgi:hypothetical protein
LIHKRNHKEQSFPSKFSIFLKVIEFKSDDVKMFISTLWYDNIDDHDFFRLENVLPLQICFVATLALARDQGKGVARLRAYK